jgi:hypothetical protein
MLAPGDMDEPRFWSIHSQRTRMIVYSPEPEFFIYIVSRARDLDDYYLWTAEHHSGACSAGRWTQ